MYVPVSMWGSGGNFQDLVPPSTAWFFGLQLRSSRLGGKCLSPLSPLAGPLCLAFYVGAGKELKSSVLQQALSGLSHLDNRLRGTVCVYLLALFLRYTTSGEIVFWRPPVSERGDDPPNLSTIQRPGYCVL